jgi:hypothetical protein
MSPYKLKYRVSTSSSSDKPTAPTETIYDDYDCATNAIREALSNKCHVAMDLLLIGPPDLSTGDDVVIYKKFLFAVAIGGESE